MGEAEGSDQRVDGKVETLYRVTRNLIYIALIAVIIVLIPFTCKFCGMDGIAARKYGSYFVRTSTGADGEYEYITVDGKDYIRHPYLDDGVEYLYDYVDSGDFDTALMIRTSRQYYGAYLPNDPERRFIVGEACESVFDCIVLPLQLFIRSDCTEEDFIEFVEENTAVTP